MSKQKDREEFVAIMAQEGVPLYITRQLMRHGATLQRLAELECSSEAADRDRVRCPGGAETCLCRDYGSHQGDGGHGTVPRIAVQGAKVEARVRALLETLNDKGRSRELANVPRFAPIFQGDPRGAVLKIKVPSGRTDDWGQTGVCVP